MAARALALAGLILFSFTAEAASTDAEFPLALSNAAHARMTASSDRFLVVWTDTSTGALQVRGRLVRASDGQATGGSFVIASGMIDDPQPAVASDGTNFFVVWRNTTTADGARLFGVRVDPSGKVIAPGAFVICPRLASDGTDSGGLYGTNPRFPAALWTGA